MHELAFLDLGYYFQNKFKGSLAHYFWYTNIIMVQYHMTVFVFVLVALAPPSLVLTYALSSPTPKSSKRYDLVVIGGGSAGLTAAKVSTSTTRKSIHHHDVLFDERMLITYCHRHYPIQIHSLSFSSLQLLVNRWQSSREQRWEATV